MKTSPALPGNESVYRTIETYEAGRFPHTLLLIGPAGSGKHALARLLAKRLLCPVRGEHTEDDEQACSVCRRIEKGIHPDFILLTADNKSNTLSLPMLREKLVATAAMLPQEGERKVYFCASPLARNAQNLLLKTLEEPPAHDVFLLSGEQESQFLDTVRSRAVPLVLSPLSFAEFCSVMPRAEEQPLLFPLSGGYPGRAEQLPDELLVRVAEWTDALLCALLTRNEYAFLATLEQTRKQEQTDTVLRCMIYLLRTTLRLAPPLPPCALTATAGQCESSWSVNLRCQILREAEQLLSTPATGRNLPLRNAGFTARLFS